MQPLRIQIQTDRLELVAVWAELARAAIDDRQKLAQLLNARIPEQFPPEIMRDVMEYFAQQLEADPDLVGWWVWYSVLSQAGQERVLIGAAGFNGYPDKDGNLLLGYSVVEGYEGQGYATETVQGLLSWAFNQPRVKQVVATTFPEHVASLRVMEKNHFILLGKGNEVETVKYGITRDRWQNLPPGTTKDFDLKIEILD
jgi:[ribosomal protein S5]-alanine N-acetyltransferase